MAIISVDFAKEVGKVKPMHATNNGPVVKTSDVKNGTTHPVNCNLYEFKAAGIPYARTHDSSYYHRYGIEHTVDVSAIFPNFDADPYHPDSYEFDCTDEYLKGCELAETEVFYRLGQRIEHTVKKFHIDPPKDYKKWAVICEHIIRHYTEGWANGYRMKITYWEIWNEPDLWWNTSQTRTTWTGTPKQFFDFYHEVATHLKGCFPHLKIGGPALALDVEWAEDFLAQLSAPLDFFSWHVYAHDVEKMVEKEIVFRNLLDKYGFTNTESILNEWNYVLEWEGDNFVYSHEQRRKEKGAAFTLAAMCASQYAPVDMLMYYDARPDEFWNGMFDMMAVGRVLKGYYPFPMFNTLYRLGRCVEVSADANAYLCAAKSDNEGAIVMTHFNDDDSTLPQSFALDVNGFGGENGVEVETFILDKTRNLESLGKMTYYADRFSLQLSVPNFTSYLFKLKKL